MAEAWGVLPDDVEARVAALWADRFLALTSARAKAMQPKKKLKTNSRRLV